MIQVVQQMRIKKLILKNLKYRKVIHIFDHYLSSYLYITLK